MPADPHQAYLDHMAQQAGFHDYATWAAWQRMRTEALTNSHTTQAAGPQGQPPKPAQPEQPQNFLQYLMNAWRGAVK